MLPNLTSLSLTPHPGHNDTGPVYDKQTNVDRKTKPYDRERKFLEELQRLKDNDNGKKAATKWLRDYWQNNGGLKTVMVDNKKRNLKWWEKFENGAVVQKDNKEKQALVEMALLELKKKGVDSSQIPESSDIKQKYRALLRFFFNRTNPELEGPAKYRDWYKSVEPELRKARVAWALAVVSAHGFDPANPELPPNELYHEKDVKVPNTWSDKVASFALYDTTEKVSTEGGEAMWKYMRWMEKQWPGTATIDPVISELGALPSGAAFLEDAVRNGQVEDLGVKFKDYMELTQSLPEDVSYKYTESSSPFKNFLLNKNEETHSSFSAKNVHQLYKTIQGAPRPSTVMHFLRSVEQHKELPHMRQGVVDPKPGSVFPNVTFISTSVAAPSDYMKGTLSGFFTKNTNCCFMIITTPPGFPILPLVVGKSAFKKEQEVLLPAGTLLIYRETIMSDSAIKGATGVKFVCYDASLPSAESLKEYQKYAKTK